MARAAINIVGITGEIFDLTSLGSREVDSYRKDVGIYCVTGSLGLVPFPPIDQGWGYSLHPSENTAKVDATFSEGLLTVTVTMNGEPYDLKTMITLHILVPDLPPQEIQPAQPIIPDPIESANSEIARLRSIADYAIAPLQDAVDVDEATDAEVASLKAWKKYRVALSRVTDQIEYPDSVEWPQAPA
ncbi:phage tail protein [Pseudomonas sp. BCA14]|uniref:tail fiber assembly protein n=1 Tax=unclassified Pseudomonas TaxID=196821 RepID=UPI00106EE66B|nr:MULTISPECIES: tail fiber assembly protein [unclassified Pseudomonas]TFF09660.1 phage tail protein [Pseudomonas sp. JMN1]TFF11802.1 phage tail protein [Pseudomonas sp. BCA17]TFF28578.1 phage tail protein [Pseudomonas sp. BCA14]